MEQNKKHTVSDVMDRFLQLPSLTDPDQKLFQIKEHMSLTDELVAVARKKLVKMSVTSKSQEEQQESSSQQAGGENANQQNPSSKAEAEIEMVEKAEDMIAGLKEKEGAAEDLASELPDRTAVLLPIISKERTKEENHKLLNGNGVDPADWRPRAQVNGKIDSNGVHTDNSMNGA